MEVLSFLRLNIISIIGITYNTIYFENIMKPYFHMDYVIKVESVTLQNISNFSMPASRTLRTIYIL